MTMKLITSEDIVESKMKSFMLSGIHLKSLSFSTNRISPRTWYPSRGEIDIVVPGFFSGWLEA